MCDIAALCFLQKVACELLLSYYDCTAQQFSQGLCGACTTCLPLDKLEFACMPHIGINVFIHIFCSRIFEQSFVASFDSNVMQN